MRNLIRVLLGGGLILLLCGLQGCASLSSEAAEKKGGEKAVAAEKNDAAFEQAGKLSLPVRFQTPSYFVKDSELAEKAKDEETIMAVGTDLSSSAGPMKLREIMKLLTELKDMTVSWASDVDQNAMVDVDIGMNDDFFKSIDNLLRQVDYYHEVHGNTIVIMHNVTKKYHIAMPFTASSYSTSVGGNVLGGTTASNQITSSENKFNVWEKIKSNLQEIFDRYSATQAEISGNAAGSSSPSTSSSSSYWMVDEPIGLITVTAPRLLQEKIADYLGNLKKELYRQVSIEAKIVEVTLTKESVVGINWTNLVQDVNAQLGVLGGVGQAYPALGLGISQVIISPGTNSGNAVSNSAGVFNLVLNAIAKSDGETKILSSPKLITMNGQPAMINVGTNITYIARVVTTTVDGSTSTSIEDETLFDGLGMSIVPMITDDNEIVVSLTPVISSLAKPLADSTFSTGGANGSTLTTPEINMREMNTMVRIKSGDTLVVGGLMKETKSNSEVGKIPILGDIPFLGNFFKQTTKTNPKTELLIILQPTIL